MPLGVKNKGRSPIKREVSKGLKVNEESLMHSQKGKKNLSRMMAIGLTRKMTGLTYLAIREEYNVKSYATVRKYCERFRHVCKNSKKIARMYEQMLERCNHVTT